MAVGGTTLRTLMALCAALCLCAGCSTVEVTGKATPAGELDPATVAGLPVTQGPSGPKPGVSNAGLNVRNTDNGDMDHLAENALSDIFTYWSQQLPADFGKRFTPITTLISFDSNGTNLKVCGGQDTTGVENAFFCPVDDSVAWDRGTLLPVLNQTFGPMAVVTVFAHEMGHAVQFQLGSVTAKTPTIIKEQQADCYAGAFMRWVAQGDAPHFRLSTGNGLSQVLATMMFIRDQVGTTSTDEAAHGSAFDRVTAFQFGFSDGPVRCDKIDGAEIQQRITELGFTSESLANDNVPVDPQTLQLLGQSLGATFTSSSSGKALPQPRIVAGDGSCASGASTPPASYCAEGNTVDIDQDKLNVLATLPQNDQLGVGSGSLGDFAAFGEIASRYVLAVQKAQKIPLTDPNAGLRTACLTGAWAGVARHRFADGPQQQLLLGPGDLDEAVAELLSPNSLIAADVNGKQVPSGFARVQAFQIGFLQGSKNCLTEFNWG
ncbi:MAG TPA: neutral zinc metallopeptidase [Pseudonocardiaceae bacterium]|nr:neutral zinc metallopeptidase [Pseudonocardiaceae bacterium]